MTDPTTIGPVTEDIGHLEREDEGWSILQHDQWRVVSYPHPDDPDVTDHSLQILGTDGHWHEVHSSPHAGQIDAELSTLGGHAGQLRKKWTGGASPLGQELRSERERRGLTQAEAAEEIDVAQDTVAAWEAGRRTPSGLYRRTLMTWLEQD